MTTTASSAQASPRQRLGGFVYEHHEHVYHFEGLRIFKGKFRPVWTPNDVACARGPGVARAFIDADRLVSGHEGPDNEGSADMIERYADHSANERTFLAWVRTVIAIEGFGIAAARIGDRSGAAWTEPALLAAGALVIGLAFTRMRTIRARINASETVEDDAVSADALLLLLILALFGLIGVFALHVG
ncbi:YidH family protein [Roseicyclus sediminis]|uniref:YidH family protein n=1 Tax=Roseicyclus sediminis TaxID=2980997 RepID=UPI00292A510A|nr:DUF202 domain-containing protein [Roseibacterium sp. SDUM158016]